MNRPNLPPWTQTIRFRLTLAYSAVLIGLSALEADMQRNIQLLKERSWFDIPIVYNNNRRAILAMEKGTPGEKAFNDAFASWRQ